MPLIRQLPPSVINKIAAGEVIERPASVVKELLENSIDAGARRIDVTVEQGGIELVRIVDDGCGIAPEQLSLAVAPHATSKLETAEDLFRVRTLGFRGEALASIAEVSQTLIRSRQPTAPAGAEVSINGGEIGPVEPCGAPVGTTIEVRQLFHNTPVRKKFLRSTATEFGHVTEALTRAALAYPGIHFTLRHGSRMVHDLPPTERLDERVAAFFGRELGDELLWIESRDEQVWLRGYVARPTQTRGNNRLQYLFLNGRAIRDRALQHALTEAYRGLIMVGRFPIAFLQLDMPPEMVDVNVHPTKMEVRFQDGGRLYSQLLGTLRGKFLTTDLTARLHSRETALGINPAGISPPHSSPPPARAIVAPSPITTEQSQLPWDLDDARERANAQGLPGRLGLPGMQSTTVPGAPVLANSVLTTAEAWHDAHGAHDPLQTARHKAELLAWARQESSGIGVETENPPQFGPAVRGDTDQLPADEQVALDLPSTGGSRLELVPFHRETASVAPPAYPGTAASYVAAGQQAAVATRGSALRTQEPNTSAAPTQAGSAAIQIHNRYLVAETDEGLVVIDQHALHERILYEQIRNKVLAGDVERQELLVPEPIDLTATEAAAILARQELLEKLGIGVAAFGGSTILVTSYPAMLANFRPQEVLRSVVEHLQTEGKTPERRDLLDELLHMVACKAAIKAGDHLSPPEVAALVSQRHFYQDSHHCPHGRPTMLVFTQAELDKQFGRI
ncbi:MAG: DNA mismatch repair endonuclease MutL [Pirellulales bacterium]|nr:DNA mismatch repair endonuclease MutL [Pirellulales bacterium]